MDRRTFVITIASGALAAPLGVRAQQPIKVRRIGFLRVGVLPMSPVFLDSMQKLGWVEGGNFKMKSRLADKADQLPSLATELVNLKIDLMITNGTPATLAAKQATKTIPIVFFLAADPVQNGVVASLSRPGGNITGFAYGLYGGKLLEILKAALPEVSRVAVPAVPLLDEGLAILRAGNALGV